MKSGALKDKEWEKGLGCTPKDTFLGVSSNK